MLPKPDVGQRVRVEGRDGDFIVKAVSADGGIVDLVSEADSSVEVTGVACLSLMLPEVEFQTELRRLPKLDSLDYGVADKAKGMVRCFRDSNALRDCDRATCETILDDPYGRCFVGNIQAVVGRAVDTEGLTNSAWAAC